jgi:hypothetical protein
VGVYGENLKTVIGIIAGVGIYQLHNGIFEGKWFRWQRASADLFAGGKTLLDVKTLGPGRK